MIHDLGSYPTHKAQIISLHLQGLNTQEIGRLTYHAPQCVDRYIDDFERVLLLYRRLGKGRSINKITFYSGLSVALVKQYYAIIKNIRSYCKTPRKVLNPKTWMKKTTLPDPGGPHLILLLFT